MLAPDALPLPCWSPALGPRERRAALVAVALSVAAHLAALGLLPDWRPGSPPPQPTLRATLRATLLPPPPLPAASRPAEARPLPAPTPPRLPPEPVAKLQPATPPRPAPLLRREATPAAPRVSPSASAPEANSAAAETPTTPAPGAAIAAPPPAHAATAPAAEPNLLARYGQTLSDLLARQQQYPRLAAARGWEGEVVLKLIIARKGQLVGAQVLRSSGHAVLDESALALAAAAQPFPPVPGQTSDGDLEVTVPVHYQLRKG